jgi:hypothetical protein
MKTIAVILLKYVGRIPKMIEEPWHQLDKALTSS